MTIVMVMIAIMMTTVSMMLMTAVTMHDDVDEDADDGDDYKMFEFN